MSCAPHAFSLSCFTALAVAGFAAEPPGASSAAERPAILAPPTPAAPVTEVTPATPQARPRLVSPTVAAQLAVAVPKFEPAPSAEPTPNSAPDLRETDKPRNTIVRLPRYLVQEDRPPVFKERELLTPQARRKLAFSKFPGLHVGSFWIFRNDGIAAAMLAEEERLEKKREFEGLAELMRFGSPADHASTKREVEQAFFREADFGR